MFVTGKATAVSTDSLTPTRLTFGASTSTLADFPYVSTGVVHFLDLARRQNPDARLQDRYSPMVSTRSRVVASSRPPQHHNN